MMRLPPDRNARPIFSAQSNKEDSGIALTGCIQTSKTTCPNAPSRDIHTMRIDGPDPASPRWLAAP
jgi:hypothetical protein